jgi:chitinase
MDQAGFEDKQLTICESADYANTAARQNLDDVARYVDFVNVMTYDMTGAYDNTTGFQAAVYANPYTPFSVDQAITGYLKHFKPEQLNVGVATYSRGWANVVPGKNGELRGQPAGTRNPAPDSGHPDADVNSRYYRGNGDSGAGKYEVSEGWSAGKHKATDIPAVVGKWYGLYPGACFRLETIKEMIKDTSRYTYYYDAQAEAPYLYDSKDKVFLSFEDERSTQAKVDYVNKHDLGGLIYWETSTDIKAQGFPILKVMYDGMSK